MIARRGLLGAALAAPAIAHAQANEVIIGTWGGDYGALLASEVDAPLVRPLGLTPVQDLGSPSARKTKLIAERSARRGSQDVVCLGDADCYAMAELGLVEELTPDKVPNIAHVLPALRSPFVLPHIYSVRVMLTNPAVISPAPVSYADMWDERFRNRIGFSDLLYQSISEAAALAGGGNESDFAPGQARLRGLKALGARVYSANENLAAALKSGEVAATIMWLARGYAWRRAGIAVQATFPAEGATPYVSAAVVPKNARNKQAAYAYLNAMLDPRAALGFGERMGYLPTTTLATLPAPLLAEIGVPAEQLAKLRRPDFGYTARNAAEILAFWEREFKA